MNFDDFKGHVYLIDDDPSISRSLAFALGQSKYSVQTFSNPESFLRDSLPLTPAVILLDMYMPQMQGVELQKRLLQSGRETPIIFISGESHPQEIVTAMKQGAIEFLLKPFGMSTLLTAVENGLARDRAHHTQLVRKLEISTRFKRLTDKEREVCSLMIRGFGNKEISEINGSAPATVKLHRSRVLDKMGIDSLPELVDMAMRDENFMQMLQDSTPAQPRQGPLLDSDA